MGDDLGGGVHQMGMVVCITASQPRTANKILNSSTIEVTKLSSFSLSRTSSLILSEKGFLAIGSHAQ